MIHTWVKPLNINRIKIVNKTLTTMDKLSDQIKPLRFCVIVATTLITFLVCLLDIGPSDILEVPHVSAQETYDAESTKFEKVWEGRDSFDEILAKLTAVNADTCSIMHVGDLKLPLDTVSHIPDIKEININPVFPNRTSLLHLHNMALNRAFYFSYILQSR